MIAKQVQYNLHKEAITERSGAALCIVDRRPQDLFQSLFEDSFQLGRNKLFGSGPNFWCNHFFLTCRSVLDLTATMFDWHLFIGNISHFRDWKSLPLFNYCFQDEIGTWSWVAFFSFSNHESYKVCRAASEIFIPGTMSGCRCVERFICI